MISDNVAILLSLLTNCDFAPVSYQTSWLLYLFFFVTLLWNIFRHSFAGIDQNHLFFLESLFWRKLKLVLLIFTLPYFLFITRSFTLDTSDKFASWINSSCLTAVCWENASDGILHPSWTITSSESSYLLASNNK